jgi:K+-sensing histidine kinase KdpD
MATTENPIAIAPLGRQQRASREAVEEGRRKLFLDHSIAMLLEALPDFVMVLNQERQVLAANSRLLRAFGLDEKKEVVGKRPGEALGCIFSGEGAGGCGTGNHCTVCGALHSILESQAQGALANYECHVTLANNGGKALDLEVISTPASIDGMQFTVCVLKDISSDKRRRLLERVFFHDVLNTAGGIHGIAELLQQHLEPDKDMEYRQWMLELTARLIEEINHQKRLLAAEQGDFKPSLSIVNVEVLLSEVQALYGNSEISAERSLVLLEPPKVAILSDSAILRRILGNLVKNALEASAPGETVTISCVEKGEEVAFSVHNPGVIPQEVQLQIFQRSFSTKGEGRGIGTYSVKLFGEKYLKGKISFVSRKPEGTTFTFILPKH